MKEGDFMAYKIGMDIGSTTIKAIVLNHANEIVYQSYERHKARIKEAAFDKIKELKEVLKNQTLYISITGSAGMQIAEQQHICFVQEVFACALAVRKDFPQSDVVVELGGEDAKIIYLQGSLEERMNSTCAGGTGSFIDQMAVLLNVTLDEMDTLSQSYERLYPIASRCGVFAKSDIQPLLNQGVSKADLSASIFQAVVEQTITGLAQGRAIDGNVLFLGGPLHFFKGLQQRFKSTLQLGDNQALFPKIGPYVVALGAAYYAQDHAVETTYQEVLQKMEQMMDSKQTYQGMAPLFENDQEYLQFYERHHHQIVEKNELATYIGDAYLGIDAGSTTTKLLLLDNQQHILYECYQNNLGNPIDIVKNELLKLYDILPPTVTIKASAVTGYGEELLKNAFHIDMGVVETIAHYTAAKAFNPQVDFIIDIGGQDMKCFRIKDQSIDDIILNEACSSGCGSFIETFAKNMGYSVEEFADMGLASTHPVNLGSRCTVFMNSSVKEAQKNGASIEDISAGLCMSVVKNALYKVIRVRRPEDLGQHIIVQGGTFLNDTILRSFEKELQREVVRPNIAGLMGAYGAALLAQKEQPKTSALITLETLRLFHHTSKATRCGLCSNHCSLTVNTFEQGRTYIAGNKCERPTQHQKHNLQDHSNIYTYKYQQLRGCVSTGGKQKIGIPLVLNMYDLLPFWNTFFSTLHYEVIISDESSQALYKSGLHSIPSDTVCFPAKLIHGHIHNLIDKQVPAIFYPNMTYAMDEHNADNHFNCPVVAYYPELVSANIEFGNVEFVSPFLSLENDEVMSEILYKTLTDHNMKETKADISHAILMGKKSLSAWREQVKEEGCKAIAYAREHRLPMIVLCGRPYHIDPMLHHGIAGMLNELGFVVLSEDCIPHINTPNLQVLNQWTYHARMYQAAQFASMNDDINIVQLVSFGCGIDAITTDEMKDILRNHKKLYTQLKIDEVDNLGAARIRLRSLKEAILERRKNGTR